MMSLVVGGRGVGTNFKFLLKTSISLLVKGTSDMFLMNVFARFIFPFSAMWADCFLWFLLLFLLLFVFVFLSFFCVVNYGLFIFLLFVVIVFTAVHGVHVYMVWFVKIVSCFH